jgi:hypothetical protein
MIKTSLAAAAAVAALFGAAPAGAVSFVFTPGSNIAGVGYSPQTGYVVINDFNSPSDLAGITGHDFELHAAGSDSAGAQPFFTTPGNTSYLSVLGPAGGPGVANLTFAAPLSTFEFDWGSIDSYNTLTIHLASGPDFVIVPGGNFTNLADGNQTIPDTNGVFQVFAGAGESITGFTMTSSQNSFEIDNLSAPGGVTTHGTVPEPASWAMMIVGFGLAGAMFRRRRTMVAA